MESLGYLAQLHTSGGRVPTDRAYRYFVDNLMEEENYELDEQSKRKIKNVIYKTGDDLRELNKTIAQLLSELSDNLVITNIAEQDEFCKIGLSSLFGLPEFREFDKAFRMTNFFDEFENLFDEMAREFFGGSSGRWDGNDEINVFIGRENPIKDIKEETVMFARYNLPHNFTGSLTLVGPTRMDYGRNIGLIKYTTEELNKLSRQV